MAHPPLKDTRKRFLLLLLLQWKNVQLHCAGFGQANHRAIVLRSQIWKAIRVTASTKMHLLPRQEQWPSLLHLRSQDAAWRCSGREAKGIWTAHDNPPRHCLALSQGVLQAARPHNGVRDA